MDKIVNKQGQDGGQQGKQRVTIDDILKARAQRNINSMRGNNRRGGGNSWFDVWKWDTFWF